MKNVICCHWGDKYPIEYVEKLERRCAELLPEYKFNVLTPEGQGFWPKMEVLKFEGDCIFFDLDVILLKRPEALLATKTRALSVLYSRWKEGYVKTATMYNSSIMRWHGDQGLRVYEHYLKNRETYEFKHRGIDRYLYHEHVDVDLLPTGIAYSYHKGARFVKDSTPSKYRSDYEVCIFNEGVKQHELDGWIHDYWR